MKKINAYLQEKLTINDKTEIGDFSSIIIVICDDDHHDEQYSYSCIEAFWNWLKENNINNASMKHNWKQIDRKYGEGTYDCIDVDASKYWKLTKDKSSFYIKNFKIYIENDGQYVEVSDDKGHVVHINCYKYKE